MYFVIVIFYQCGENKFGVRKTFLYFYLYFSDTDIDTLIQYMLNMAGKVAVVTGGNKGTVGVKFIVTYTFLSPL